MISTTKPANPMFTPLLKLDAFVKSKEAFCSSKTCVLCVGAVTAQKEHFAKGLATQLNKPLIYVTADEQTAHTSFDNLSFFGETRVYPARDMVFYSADVKSGDIAKQRFSVLKSILAGETADVVLPIDALFDALTPKEFFKPRAFELETGKTCSIEALVKKLVEIGYVRTNSVEGAGQFALRGGILDIFGAAAETAVRVEFWGDEVDSIRTLDAYARRSVTKIDKTIILPTRELIYDNETLKKAINLMENEYSLIKDNFINEKREAELLALKSGIGEDLEKLKEQGGFLNADKYIGFFYPKISTFLDYIPENSLIVFDDPARIAERAANMSKEFHESIENRISKGLALPTQARAVVSLEDTLARAKIFGKLIFSPFDTSQKMFEYDESYNIVGKSVDFRDGAAFYSTLTSYGEYSVAILAGGNTRGERLTLELTAEGYAAHFDEFFKKPLTPKTIKLTTGTMTQSFEYPDIKLAVLSMGEVQQKRKKRRNKRENSEIINSFSDLKPGDYVVHDNHGIGVFCGVEKVEVDNIFKDYMKIAYLDDGVLYVQASQLDLIHKYIGGEEGAKIKLNKLGGQEWQKAKTRARGAIEIVAKDLVELYARREASKGFAFSNDNVWQKEFEEQFPYEETDDQVAAIEDVKRDMESIKIMDRLICGDVGYGKTEVAIRAAFKAVQDSKQVAVLVPTTILARQHFTTFTQRMKEYPIAVGMLSRFGTPTQQAKALDGLRTGKIDIIIGTHRILAKNIEFNNLGLIIVDEEQRFGVSHKERLKRLRNNVDVMTLTATPIPRTLHMSLSGIRDISILSEPPDERRPVQTYVMEYSAEAVRDAISRELARGGQVYYVHNRVFNIAEAVASVQALQPNATVGFAHGQMSERELESIMLDFVEGELDVLVCTTIIETGLDIPNVNTIIIQDADKMGLAQLYQLRGRVGRSNRTAYAYLMYKRDKILTESSQKRLQTIREFTEFGSGFKIAMRDLEIRGAGSLFGAEQSGFMEAIGYDLYRKMLFNAVNKIKAEQELDNSEEDYFVDEMFETQIDIAINAFIPPFYIEDESDKLEVYKKIALIRSENDFSDVTDEIVDRFGNVPLSVKNLLDIALVKALAHAAGIISIIQKTHIILATFRKDALIDTKKINESVKSSNGQLLFTANGTSVYITYKLLPGTSAGDALRDLKQLFIKIKP